MQQKKITTQSNLNSKMVIKITSKNQEVKEIKRKKQPIKKVSQENGYIV